MESILVLGALTGGAWWVGKQLYQAGRSANSRRARRRESAVAASEYQHRERLSRQRQIREHQQKQAVRQRGLNRKYRALQVALLQINQAPDFQRAASLAEAARDIPLASRQRQYRRFRPQLVRHYIRRLRSGAEAQLLLDSLTTLVEALGIAGFEASYIQQEASRQVQNRNRQPAENYSATLERMQQEHTDRTAALNQTSLDPDTKQQLLEAQNQRLVESLMEMTLGQQGETT
ncbi:hypothetical protein Pan241w_58380 [Gimesia alba]|uniref:Uncharacterized protein n=1 Tax=Gimesia alba TaxID=2527973 RepID=A0A517RPA0_9PLAN|nr:hypothetical protein [Gimesia alba]QDT45711.1 hypothetical protein Pan241w_58380 [Gimesia alba]